MPAPRVFRRPYLPIPAPVIGLALLTAVLLGLFPTNPAAAQDDERAAPVLTERAERNYIYGHAYLGWAFSFSQGGVAMDHAPNQFYLDRLNLGYRGTIDPDDQYRFRIEFEALGGLDDQGVQGLGIDGDRDGFLGDIVLKYGYLQARNFPVEYAQFYAGIVPVPWVTWEEKLTGIRALRRVAGNLFGYLPETDVGFTHVVYFQANLIELRWGIYNGQLGHYSPDGIGQDGGGISDLFKTVAAQFILKDASGFGTSIALFLQNSPGNDNNSNISWVGDPYAAEKVHEDGWRLLAGVYFNPRDPEMRQPNPVPFTVALTAGLVKDYGQQDQLPGFASLTMDIGAGMIDSALTPLSLIFRFDVHQLDFNDPTRSEPGNAKYLNPDGTRKHPDIILEGEPGFDPAANSQYLGGWEIGFLLAVRIELAEQVFLLPGIRGDYSDASPDATLLMLNLQFHF